MAANSSEKKIYVISLVPDSSNESGMVRASHREPKAAAQRTAFPALRESVKGVSLNTFAAHLESTTSSLGEIFQKSFEDQFGDFQLDEVEVNLEVAANGTVGFLGTGAGVRGSSSLKLKFKRKK